MDEQHQTQAVETVEATADSAPVLSQVERLDQAVELLAAEKRIAAHLRQELARLEVEHRNVLESGETIVTGVDVVSMLMSRKDLQRDIDAQTEVIRSLERTVANLRKTALPEIHSKALQNLNAINAKAAQVVGRFKEQARAVLDTLNELTALEREYINTYNAEWSAPQIAAYGRKGKDGVSLFPRASQFPVNRWHLRAFINAEITKAFGFYAESPFPWSSVFTEPATLPGLDDPTEQE